MWEKEEETHRRVRVEEFQEEIKRVLKPNGSGIHILPTATWRFWSWLSHCFNWFKIAYKLIISFRRTKNSLDNDLEIVVKTKKALSQKSLTLTRLQGSLWLSSLHIRWSQPISRSTKSFGKSKINNSNLQLIWWSKARMLLKAHTSTKVLLSNKPLAYYKVW